MGVDWRRNLGALWLAEFTAIFGFSFAFPFLPLFLKEDLGIHDPHQVAFYSGIAAGITGLTLAIASPLWGLLADRFGRRPMLIRAMLGGGVAVGLMGIAQSALQLTVLRAIQGGVSGTVASATALVAAETPREHVGWALGILSSAIAMGGAIAPAAGGIAGSRLGLRFVFGAGGILLLLAVVPVFLVVRETPRVSRAERPAVARVLSSAPAGTIPALVLLIVTQLLLQSSYSATQQLVVLRVLQLDQAAASGLTGIAFGFAGVATALAGVTYSRAIRWRGYRAVVPAGATLLCLTTLSVAVPASVIPLILAFMAVSFLFGALAPAITSMIGLEAPVAVAASVFGVSSSAVAAGFGVGPLLAGIVASGASITAGLTISAALAAAMGLSLALWGREPETPARPRS